MFLLLSPYMFLQQQHKIGCNTVVVTNAVGCPVLNAAVCAPSLGNLAEHSVACSSCICREIRPHVGCLQTFFSICKKSAGPDLLAVVNRCLACGFWTVQKSQRDMAKGWAAGASPDETQHFTHEHNIFNHLNNGCVIIWHRQGVLAGLLDALICKQGSSDLQEAHPGMGLPTLTPQQAAARQQGLTEMAQLRRKGGKAQKHHSSTATVQVSLEKMNAGCIKTVTR